MSIGLYTEQTYKPIIQLNTIPNFITKDARFWSLPLLRRIHDSEVMKNGDIWIALQNLIQIRDGEVVPFTEIEEFTKPPKEILITQEDDILIATLDEIYRLNGTKWDLLQSGFDTIHTIKHMKDGSLWVATDNGLYRHKDGSWISNTTDDGLPHNTVNDILEDSQGRIWAATDKGISLYHPEADLDEPDTYVINIQGEFIDQNTIPEEVPSTGNVVIEFSGMDKWNYTEVDRIAYSYRMDDDDWSSFSSETIARFNDLSWGKHTLQVKAMDRNWNIDSTPAILTLNVMLPWYRGPIFIIILSISSLIILILVLLHFFHHINLESVIKKRTKELTYAHQELLTYQKQLRSLASKMSIIEERSKREIAVKIHDQIGHSLALCQMQIEYLQCGKYDRDHSNETLNEIRQMVKQIIEDTRDLTVEISPPILYELGLLQTLKWLVEQFNGKYDMRFSLIDDCGSVELGVDERGILFTSIKELMFNVIKHAQTQLAEVLISKKNGSLLIHVNDQGVGFNTQDLQSKIMEKQSYGLFSIRERIEFMGGTFECKSQPNEGTHISMIIPLRNGEKSE
jgi:signal transduction histidine kinase